MTKRPASPASALERPARHALFALTLLVPGALSAQTAGDPVAADWLYLSPGYAWVEQSATVLEYPADIPLPVNHQHIQDLWWASYPEDSSVQHQHGLEDQLLVPGTMVSLRTEEGIVPGEIMQVLPSGLLVAAGDEAQLIAPENFDQLSMPLAGRRAGRLVMDSARSVPDTRTWAYRTDQVSGQVLYRLDLGGDHPVLFQDLRIDNPGQRPMDIRGLSYHPGDDNQRQPMLARSMVMETMGDAAATAPAESVAGQQAVLTWPQATRLEARASQWVSVQTVALEPVTHEYRWRWHGQQTTAVPADWFLHLASDGDLPALPGAVSVNWFDQAAASLASFYRPDGAHQAVLALGNNAQVTLSAEPADAADTWQVRLHNRLDSAVSAKLELHHPRSHQVNVQPHTESVSLAPGTTTLTVRFTGQGIEVGQP